MPGPFEIASVAVPLLWSDYFTTDQPQYDLISTADLLQRIAGLGANDVRLVSNFGQLATFDANSYQPFLPQSLESLKTFTDAAHARGLAISWNPISSIANVIGGDSSQSSHPDPTDPQAWFASFREVVLANARIADAIGAERYMVLSDLEQSVFQWHPELAPNMIALIGEVRTIFHGQISAIVATTNGLFNTFPESILGALDLIGLGIVPKLTNSNTATVEELRSGWHADADTGQDIIHNLEQLAVRTGKPIWLSDFVASSYDGANALLPYKYDFTATFVPDNSEQSNFYEAAFREFMAFGGSWFKGFSAQNIGRIVDDRGLLPAYLLSDVGEDFYGKPAQTVLTDFYSGLVAPETLQLRATDYGETVNGGYAYNVITAGRGTQTLNGGPLADVFEASASGTSTAHRLVLELSGVAASGVAPTFIIRVNGTSVPIDYAVNTPLSSGSGTLLTIPLLSGTISSLDLVATNWYFGGADVNRLIRVHSIKLDGQDLSPLGIYHPQSGGTEPFGADTNRGGYVSYDTHALTLVAPLTVTLPANTTINGGTGADTVVYDFTPAAYHLGFVNGALASVTKPGAGPGQGVDQLISIEQLRFAGVDYSTVDQITATAPSTIRMGFGQANSFNFGNGSVTLANLVELKSAIGSSGADVLIGGPGVNVLAGAGGNDTLDGASGADTAVYTGTRSAATVTRSLDKSLTVTTSADGTDAVHHVEQLRFSDGLYSFTFANTNGTPVVANFNPSNGWTSQDQAPRHVADVNGDGYADVVGFGTAGVLVAFGAANGSFSPVSLAVGNFGQAAGWTSDNAFHRVLADVNGDGRADIIGFGQAGTLVSLAQANGTFAAPGLGIANFGAAQGWTSDTAFHRVVGDVNGDGKADIVGFGQAGTLVALGNGDGTFKPVQTGLGNFGAAQGWTSDNTFHRELADVNGDGKADIIGFGQAGTLVALSNGDGTFQPVQSGLTNFGTAQGWASQDSFARLVADVNGDHIGDIVGFGQAGTLVAFGNGDGTFTEAGFDLANFGAAQGWTSDATFHREVADLNHDGLADIVGFGFAGVLAGMNQGDFLV